MDQNYIFYQTNKAVWFVDSKHFWIDMYQKQYKPILYKILCCTEDWINEVSQIRYDDIDQFIDIIKEELSFDTLWSN